MKTNHKILALIIWSLVSFQASWSQEDVVTLNQELLKVENRSAYHGLSEPKWKFKKGSELDWKDRDFDDSDWEQIGPGSISIDKAEDDGALEGWFRLKIKADSTLNSIPVFLYLDNYGQAIDTYLNGRKIHSIGQIETDTSEYKRARKYDFLNFIPVEIIPDSVYTLALHYVNKPMSFPANLLAKDFSLQFWTSFLDYDSTQYLENKERINSNSTIVALALTGIITIIFWLLFLIDRKDLTILLTALCITGFFFMSLNRFLHSSVMSLGIEQVYNLTFLGVLSSSLIIGMIPLIFAKIFTGHTPKILWSIFPLMMVVSIVNLFVAFDQSIKDGFAFILFTSILIYCLYLVIRSWKSLHGSQWAVVIGILIMLFIVFVSIVYFAYLNPDAGESIAFGQATTILTIVLLIFPLSLLAYAMLRFREVNEEVKSNAAQLVKVTEEKRQQTLNQKVVLEQEVAERTSELRQSLSDLKSTQAQLIQSEKMASLGELTAGIAHEIQNPLNFVNNFSDVSSELIGEAKEELEKGDISELKDLLDDLNQNLEKISHHGGRASSIVKGMLDHSRESSGEKELTDINALCDEYIRLSYHGLKAKDKNFNAEFELDLDDKLPKIAVVPQDIGRVLLNIFNNAFYAVSSEASAKEDSPKVTVSTEHLEKNIQITITDNGIGMSKETLEKVFQPFFTTKPTGQGTGLGMSISYDIVTKGHGGSIDVESKEGEGSVFVITLPKTDK